MQLSKMFNTAVEAKIFASKHAMAWVHNVFTGAFGERQLVGVMVVYIVKD